MFSVIGGLERLRFSLPLAPTSRRHQEEDQRDDCENNSNKRDACGLAHQRVWDHVGLLCLYGLWAASRLRPFSEPSSLLSILVQLGPALVAAFDPGGN